MKKEPVSNLLTLGDYSASEYLFSKKRERLNKLNGNFSLSRTEFLKYFGNPNPKKDNRYSWSGKCVPKYGIWNVWGQRLFITKSGSIYAIYSYKKDKRPKIKILCYQKIIAIAVWKKEKMKKHINSKYNQKGFFICKKENKVYGKICFGEPFNFNFFIKCFKSNFVIFDSGMYEGNNRNYSQWRIRKTFIRNLITEEY